MNELAIVHMYLGYVYHEIGHSSSNLMSDINK